MLLEFAYFEIQWWHFLVFWGTVGALVRVWRLRTPLLMIARKKTWLAIAKGSGLPASRWRDFLGILYPWSRRSPDLGYSSAGLLGCPMR